MPAPYTRILALDFETAWDSKDYTLKKLTTEEYLRDARFRVWGCAYYYLDALGTAPRWISANDLPAFFATVDWANTAVLAHNAQFDVSILTWHYEHVPCFIIDTLSIARALRGVEAKNGLAQLALEFGFPQKGEALYNTDGLLTSIPPHVERELAEYCEHDVALCVAVYDKLGAGFPTKELRLIDMTLRMFVLPRLLLDPQMLTIAIHDEKVKREGLIKRLGIAEKELASNPKFAGVLTALGVSPPKKISKTTGKETFAFAKTDAHFQALLNHDSEEIVLACEARLAVKSTLERTRAQRFLDIARRGALPVPLNYYAAHTGRWGGGGRLNLQNLRRGSFLRHAIYAPDGYSLVASDLSQIEVRVLAWLADDQNMLNVFLSGEDPYAGFGATMFNKPGMTQDSHPELRQSAKSALLGCGYALGWASFAAQLLTGFLGAPPVLYGVSMAKQLGLRAWDIEDFVRDMDHVKRMKDIPRVCSNDELAVHCTVAAKIVDTYRRRAMQVVRFWNINDGFIAKNLVEDPTVTKFCGGKSTQHKCLFYKPGAVVLPNGLSLRYADIASVADEKGRIQWTYGAANNRKKLYGGKLTENIVQAVARIVMTDGILRVQQRYPCVLTVHDEAVYLVPEDEVPEAEPWIKQQTLLEPKYLPGIPLAAKVGHGKRYGDAK